MTEYMPQVLANSLLDKLNNEVIKLSMDEILTLTKFG